jgi:hypothetical protein
LVNSQESLNLSSTGELDFTYFDWSRLQQQDTRVSLAFHTRNLNWLGDFVSLELADTSGVCFSGKLVVTLDVPISVTYVTTRHAGSEIVVHAHNFDVAIDFSVAAFEINGVEYSGPWLVGTGQSLVLTFPSQQPLAPGDLWTVSMRVSGLPSTQGWGARVIPERFPIMTWPIHANNSIV